MKKKTKLAIGVLVCAVTIAGTLYYPPFSRTILHRGTQAEYEEPTQTAEEPDSQPDTAADTEVQEPSTQTPDEEPLPDIRTVTISAVGDCALGPVQTKGYDGSFYDYYDRYGSDYFFSGVKDIFETDDFTLVNLECVLTNENERVEKMWNIKGYPEYTKILLDGSIEGCSLGNNHTFDYGEKSHTDTEEALTDAGILFAFNEKTTVYTAENGITIGVVSANTLDSHAQAEAYIKDGIDQLREAGVDLVVACCHWGIEREYYPTEYQQEAAHRIIDWGADLVIGNHPHVLQGMEIYNGKVICYSLGNFCFGANSNPADKDTLIYQQTFTFTDGVLMPDITAGIIPCRLSTVTAYNDYQPTVLEGDEKATVIDKMNRYSQAYEGISFDESGAICTGEEETGAADET